jgi:hypothetical protein
LPRPAEILPDFCRDFVANILAHFGVSFYRVFTANIYRVITAYLPRI